MKPVYYLLIVGLLASTPVLGLRRKQHSQLSQVKKFSFWPTQTYNETQNNLSLTIHPLSEEETSNLFLGEGKRLLKIKGWFFLRNQSRLFILL